MKEEEIQYIPLLKDMGPRTTQVKIQLKTSI
jgi:hypothetical protein